MSGEPAPDRWSARSRCAEETAAIGEALGRAAPDGAVILLEGPLGAGKTTLAQGVGAGCGVRDPVTSPTYNLILHYAGDRPFTHVDLYRLEDQTELETLDLEEMLGGSGVTCVEWPELLRGEQEIPWARLRISLESGPIGPRRVFGELAGVGWEAALAALAERGARPA
ncbi:MAG TPA: tRNA (adenosine(37)-N6)-threonylcarbamoyltransferase complex ATPase subunit type 1 TsaE [Gemmatimonadota bacterium]|nr:tRNA (adenosine(37)-N6)-threonylcarbamoyltransferase complex ATPase subunit type 1 TsaE [Gemmatimonadota bacterium]